jgi:hypothetical protein
MFLAAAPALKGISAILKRANSDGTRKISFFIPSVLLLLSIFRKHLGFAKGKVDLHLLFWSPGFILGCFSPEPFVTD